MFISNELVFIELHKTGCTHIGKLLTEFLDGVQQGKHNAPGPALLNSGRFFLGSIRNPWDLYVSLWAYGCGKKGLVYNLTTRPLTPDEQSAALPSIFLNAHSAPNNRPTRKPEEWKRCYDDVSSVSAFRDWLHMMNDESYWYDFGEGYSSSPIARFAGLLTYRYLTLFCRHVPSKISSIADIKAYEEKNCYINSFIRTEYLEDDFIAALKACNIQLTESQKHSIYSSKKTNTSFLRNETTYFYDDETLKLVHERERLIIDKFSHIEPGK